ncbi:HDOD domain-containing protein [Pseudothauera nasutitermitis]|uniref:HDOD domain-containing protein n=1 Tax=Pseudothauera nasutitermitis TaxID=2565930 RepID=A0A4V3WBE4_9RHOO|nr:HDOD domain-containing protein [Pseudothauera nasutitermitis]THF62909.1 HDOD domain-containing protein [Pseudothauera nasutitermitis]
MSTPAASAPRDPDVTRDQIRRFLLDAEALPSPKGAALRLIELARDPEASIDETVRVIQTDPALTGFVLRAANAARFGGIERTLDLKRAVVRAGMQMVRAHALALSMIRDHARPRCTHFNYQMFWTESLYTAVLMDRLAAHFRQFRPGEAFVLGLLAGIGRLAFATAAPDEYGTVLARAAERGVPLQLLEQQAFGFDHHELSAVLLADWGVPTELADVVYWQRDPEGGGFEPDSRPYLLAGVLQLAAGVASTALAPEAGGGGIVYLRAAMLELEEADMAELTSAGLAELREWLQLIGLPPLPKPQG